MRVCVNVCVCVCACVYHGIKRREYVDMKMDNL